MKLGWRRPKKYCSLLPHPMLPVMFNKKRAMSFVGEERQTQAQGKIPKTAFRQVLIQIHMEDCKEQQKIEKEQIVNWNLALTPRGSTLKTVLYVTWAEVVCWKMRQLWHNLDSHSLEVLGNSSWTGITLFSPPIIMQRAYPLKGLWFTFGKGG